MNYQKGLVGVVIPTYKRSEMLTRAIDSVLNQTYRVVECIVVNDNAPNDEYSLVLYEVLKQYKSDSRFRFIEQKEHKNGAAARNVGIRESKGEYISFLDDDDFWEPNKLEIQVECLSQLPQVWGAVSCLMKLYKNNVLAEANFPYRSGDLHQKVLFRRIGLGTGSLLIRRSALDETGYFDENLTRFQDPQLFSCLTSKYRIKLIKKYLHNRDADDGNNRPDAKRIEKLQNAFFKSVNNQIELLSKSEQRALYKIFAFDSFPAFWRSGDKIKALKNCFGVFTSYRACYYAIERYFRRFMNSHFKEYRINKYK